MQDPLPLTNVNTQRRVHSSLSSIKNTSTLASTKQSFILHRRSNSKSTLQSTTEAAEVKNLEFWEDKSSTKIREKIKLAKEELQRKLNNEDIVENNIKSRRSITKSTGTLDTLKEKSRFCKAYEEELVQTCKALEDQIHESLSERETLRIQSCELNTESQDHYKMLEQCNGLLESAVHELKSSTSRRRSQLALYLSTKQSYKESINKRKIELQQHIEMIHIETRKISRKLEESESKSSYLRKELRLVKQELVQHYLNLLKEGTDTRSAGLSWIVANLLGLHTEPTKEMLPTCVDERSFECILEIARKSLSLDVYYDKLAMSKAHSGLQFRPRADLKSRMQELKNNIRIRRPDFSTKRLSWNPPEMLVKQRESGFQDGIGEALKSEEQIRRIKGEILELKEEEVKRIARECLRSGGNVRTMIGYIVGIESIEKFMVLTMKELKEIETRKESTSTFSFTSRLIPKSRQKIVY